jgi:transcription initiation factor IIE alpha subunit
MAKAKKVSHTSKKHGTAQRRHTVTKSKKAAKIGHARYTYSASKRHVGAAKHNPKSPAKHGNAQSRSMTGNASNHVSVQPKHATKPVKAGAVDAAVEYSKAANVIINNLGSDEIVSSYLRKNVSKRAMEVVELLDSPKTDEDIAARLGLKINAVRRILNIMQGYGITNYNISKNVDGWLSFAWYINVNKIGQFLDYVKNMTQTSDVVKDNCNDYFICKNCYESNKLIFTFDAAYEAGFRCTCNGMLTRIGREEADRLVKEANEQISAESPQTPVGPDYELEINKSVEAYKLTSRKK